MVILSKDSSNDEDDEGQDSVEFPVQIGKYFGSKWGVYLRAPDL